MLVLSGHAEETYAVHALRTGAAGYLQKNSVGSGFNLKGIAARLQVNAKTISTYRARILGKLGLQTNADLVRYAIQRKLVGLG